jgi:hypothetical protein
MIPAFSHAETQVADTHNPDGVPLAPLLPALCLIVGLVLGAALAWAELQRLYRRCGWLALELDANRTALEAEQARAHLIEVRLEGELTAARAEAATARFIAQHWGLK